MANKSDHEFVPVHEILSENEAKDVLGAMGLEKENLPKIMKSDPQIIKIGGEEGKVVKISRNDYGNEYSYYRLIVEG